jgi:hypothetical protein
VTPSWLDGWWSVKSKYGWAEAVFEAWYLTFRESGPGPVGMRSESVDCDDTLRRDKAQLSPFIRSYCDVSTYSASIFEPIQAEQSWTANLGSILPQIIYAANMSAVNLSTLQVVAVI